jgi:hypothetical protein
VVVALHASAQHRSFRDVESGKQRRAVAHVVLGSRRRTARLEGQAGLGALKHLDLGLLVQESTTAWAGGSIESPTTSFSRSDSSESRDILKARMRCDSGLWAAQMRCTERRLTPDAFAIIRPLQCVALPAQ